MTEREAVDLLVREYRAESFRDFFAKFVRDYMGEARNVTQTDLQNIRTMINALR